MLVWTDSASGPFNPAQAVGRDRHLRPQAYGRGAALQVQGSGLKSAAIDLCGFETPGHQPEQGGIPNNKNKEPALPDAGVHAEESAKCKYRT